MFNDKENELLNKMMDLPTLPLLVERFKVALDNEKIKRKQFYADIDDDLKAEFINGEIFIHSPVKKEHTDTTGSIYRLFHTYVLINELGYVSFEKVLSAFTRNDYEPDVVFF